ncbi:hypothetical protein DY000_02021973 [Brassica cretica]|uniref:TLDc domain-containing protein n=1 Tax=Brassica cretica TaxID=69181 RepID=A0ABQ7ENX9_BRACR|nr:hypothetical protein DY000_02021973 [Brassica cretica]
MIRVPLCVCSELSDNHLQISSISETQASQPLLSVGFTIISSPLFSTDNPNLGTIFARLDSSSGKTFSSYFLFGVRQSGNENEEEESESCPPKHGNGKHQAATMISSGQDKDSELHVSAKVESDYNEGVKQIAELTESSAFISADLFEFLHSCLPNIVRGCKWILLYSTLKHGISLRTLLRRSADLPGPCLLVCLLARLSDTFLRKKVLLNGRDLSFVMIGFSGVGCWRQTRVQTKHSCSQLSMVNHAYLDLQVTIWAVSFSFLLEQSYGQLNCCYKPKKDRVSLVDDGKGQVPTDITMCMNELLAFGGGGSFALCLDEDLLKATSGPSETFGNECLASSTEFELKNVELWGFAHASQYLFS